MATDRNKCPDPQQRKGVNYYLYVVAVLLFAAFAKKRTVEELAQHHYFRRMSDAVGPDLGKAVHILRSVMYSTVPLFILFWFVNLIVSMQADAEDARAVQQFLYKAEPILRIVLFFTVFSPFWYGRVVEEHIATMSTSGAKQLTALYFEHGDVHFFPWLGERAYLHSLGDESQTTIARSKIELLYYDPETKTEDGITMTGPDGAPVAFINTPILVNPFLNVGLLRQGGPDAVSRKYHDMTSSYCVLAPSKAAKNRKDDDRRLLLNDLLQPATGQELFEEGLEALQDDEQASRSYRICIKGREEDVVDTGTGYGLTDVSTEGMTPDPQVIESMNKRRATITEAHAKAAARVIEADGEAKAKVIQTEGETKAYELAVKLIKKYGSNGLPEGQAALILTGALSGEEVSIRRWGIDIGGGNFDDTLEKLEAYGINAEWLEKLFGHVSSTAKAFAGTDKSKSSDKGTGKKSPPKKDDKR